MGNFNTNQARHLYVAKDVKTLSNHTTDPATVLTTKGDIAVGSTADKDIYFIYRNADDNIVRSDTINAAKIQYMTVAEADDLAIPLNKVTITLKSAVSSSLSSLIGKNIQLTINLKEQIGLDYSENYPIVVNLYCTSTNTANAAALYTALKNAIKDAIANFPSAPFVVSETSTSNVTITECAQKWVPEKFEADPIHFEVFASELDSIGEPWATITPASAGTTVSGDFKIADLERFSYRERGDILGMTVWPYNYEPHYLVEPVLGTNTYGMLTIQYYYSGEAEDIQKSPRTIQIAATDADIAEIKSAIELAIADSGSGSGSGSSSGSGSGSGSGAAEA